MRSACEASPSLTGPRIQNRLRALADQGLIKESAAAPDRWMIVLASDPSDDD